MHAHYMLAARPNLKHFTGELEPQTCSILWASFDGVAQPLQRLAARLDTGIKQGRQQNGWHRVPRHALPQLWPGCST